MKEVNQEEEMLTSLLTNGHTSDQPGRKKKGKELSPHTCDTSHPRFYVAVELCVFSDNPQVSVLKKSASHVSGTEADDTGDELLESAFRSAATAGPRQRTERKRSQYRHRKSC